ncbi:MAG: hypothetical protein AAFQ82_24820, partial [Myxococcota bacterium]
LVRWSVWDTAGLREAPGTVEAQGIEMARSRIAEADLALWLTPAMDPHWPEDGVQGWVVLSRIDEVDDTALTQRVGEGRSRGFAVESVSALRGDGVEELRSKVDEFLSGDDRQTVLRERQIEALKAAMGSVEATLRGLSDGVTLDVLTAELEGAVHALGRVLGRDVELEILDRIFRDFCIGK